MFGSSSTTSRRASGAGRPFGWLPVTAPPAGRADAVVMTGSFLAAASAVLDGTCEEPGKPLAGHAVAACAPRSAPRSFLAAMLPGLSAAGRHRPATPPVADRVVLRAAQSPPAAQVGAHGPDGGRLGGHPGEQVVAVG